ncbi:unnamed protein product [Prunus armeniaca]
MGLTGSLFRAAHPPADLSPTLGPAVRTTEGLFARVDDSRALLVTTCDIESAPHLIVHGLADKL